MKQVFFKDKGHTYQDTDGNEYTSVSRLWKKYFQDFDAEDISMKKAYKELDFDAYTSAKRKLSYSSKDLVPLLIETSQIPVYEIKKTALAFRDEWAAKSQRGTDVHLKLEMADYERGYAVSPFDGKEYTVISWKKKRGHDNETFEGILPDGYVPELLVANHDYKIAGQIDRCFIETIDGVRYVDIDDYKTDRVIEDKSFFMPGEGFRMMKYPVDHLYDTNRWQYTLKISTYAYTLELMGFTPRNLAFTHVQVDDNNDIVSSKMYAVPYKKEEVKNILKIN